MYSSAQLHVKRERSIHSIFVYKKKWPTGSLALAFLVFLMALTCSHKGFFSSFLLSFFFYKVVFAVLGLLLGILQSFKCFVRMYDMHFKLRLAKCLMHHLCSHIYYFTIIQRSESYSTTTTTTTTTTIIAKRLVTYPGI